MKDDISFLLFVEVKSLWWVERGFWLGFYVWIWLRWNEQLNVNNRLIRDRVERIFRRSISIQRRINVKNSSTEVVLVGETARETISLW